MLDILQMNRTFGNGWRLVMIATALLWAAGGGGVARAADSPDAVRAKAKLAAVRARIAGLTNRRAAALATRDALAARLRAAELEITTKHRALDELHVAMLAVERRGAQLQADRQRDLQALDKERSALAGQIVAAYMIGRDEQIKMLLNQTNPADVGRVLTYYGYFGRARATQINAIRDRLRHLQIVGLEIDRQSVRLKDLQDDGRRALADLERARRARGVALLAVAKQIQNSNQELAALRRQEQSVESLLADLASVLQDFPTDTRLSFAQLRGKLPWPVGGRLMARFHDVRAETAQDTLRWQGVLIESARGAKVRAPYFGRVVYADWLQGLGLLMIISHSGGFLSLYGHAEVLYKSVGDWVAPGDVIAEMSDTQGPLPQLYFEIRQGRKPLDPAQWLRSNP